MAPKQGEEGREEDDQEDREEDRQEGREEDGEEGREEDRDEAAAAPKPATRVGRTAIGVAHRAALG